MWSGYRGADQSSPGRRGSTRKIIVILNHFTVLFRGTIKVQLSEYSPWFPSLISLMVSVDVKHHVCFSPWFIVRGLCESRGGRPGLSVLTSFLVSVDVKNY